MGWRKFLSCLSQHHLINLLSLHEIIFPNRPNNQFYLHRALSSSTICNGTLWLSKLCSRVYGPLRRNPTRRCAQFNFGTGRRLASFLPVHKNRVRGVVKHHRGGPKLDHVHHENYDPRNQLFGHQNFDPRNHFFRPPRMSKFRPPGTTFFDPPDVKISTPRNHFFRPPRMSKFRPPGTTFFDPPGCQNFDPPEPLFSTPPGCQNFDPPGSCFDPPCHDVTPPCHDVTPPLS